MFLNVKPKELEILKKYDRIAKERRTKDTDYSNTVNVKPWGHEFLIFQNDRTAIWLMHLKKGQSTSLHCHFKKDTFLVNLNGVVLVNLIDDEQLHLPLMEHVYIPKGKFHGFTSLHDETVILEIEVFGDNLDFSDKNDLLRLRDVYNRSDTGYEGSVISLSDPMSLQKYGAFMLSVPGPLGAEAHTVLGGASMALSTEPIPNANYSILLKGIVRTEFGAVLKEGSVMDPGADYQSLGEANVVLNVSRPDYKEDAKIVWDLIQLEHVVTGHRAEGKRLVLTSGCFDIVHTGHIHHLREAKKHGDILMVCLSNDEQISMLKGVGRPVNKYQDRIDLLKSIPYIDHVVLYDEANVQEEATLDEIMRITDADVWTKGDDYTAADIKAKHPTLRNIVLISNIRNKSTTHIVNRICVAQART